MVFVVDEFQKSVEKMPSYTLVRDVTFLIEHSGSMSGGSFEAALGAAQAVHRNISKWPSFSGARISAKVCGEEVRCADLDNESSIEELKKDSGSFSIIEKILQNLNSVTSDRHERLVVITDGGFPEATRTKERIKEFLNQQKNLLLDVVLIDSEHSPFGGAIDHPRYNIHCIGAENVGKIHLLRAQLSYKILEVVRGDLMRVGLTKAIVAPKVFSFPTATS